MVALREVAYASMGGDYDFGGWAEPWGYEYLKDVRTYVSFIAVVYLYRFVLRRWQGEAGFISEGREDIPAEPLADRFLVKKLGREFLVKVDQIDWIEASGNYVNRSEEHTSELQSLMRISYAVFCLKKKTQ